MISFRTRFKLSWTTPAMLLDKDLHVFGWYTQLRFLYSWKCDIKYFPAVHKWCRSVREHFTGLQLFYLAVEQILLISSIHTAKPQFPIKSWPIHSHPITNINPPGESSWFPIIFPFFSPTSTSLISCRNFSRRLWSSSTCGLPGYPPAMAPFLHTAQRHQLDQGWPVGCGRISLKILRSVRSWSKFGIAWSKLDVYWVYWYFYWYFLALVLSVDLFMSWQVMMFWSELSSTKLSFLKS